MRDQHPELAGGRVIDNPISGERIVIRLSGAETDGRLLAFDLFLPPGGHVPATHAHPAQEERFTVIDGQLRFRVGRRTILAQPGQTIVVKAGTAHWFGNTGAQTAVARVEVRPALRMEELLERTGTIGATGRFGGTSVPRLPDLAAVLLEFEREVAVPRIPGWLVRALLLAVTWFAHRRHGLQT